MKRDKGRARAATGPSGGGCDEWGRGERFWITGEAAVALIHGAAAIGFPGSSMAQAHKQTDSLELLSAYLFPVASQHNHETACVSSQRQEAAVCLCIMMESPTPLHETWQTPRAQGGILTQSLEDRGYNGNDYKPFASRHSTHCCELLIIWAMFLQQYGHRPTARCSVQLPLHVARACSSWV